MTHTIILEYTEIFISYIALFLTEIQGGYEMLELSVVKLCFTELRVLSD